MYNCVNDTTCSHVHNNSFCLVLCFVYKGLKQEVPFSELLSTRAFVKYFQNEQQVTKLL